MAFTNEQMERYSRHIILQEVGVKGQKKLLNGKVLIIGAGGLGAPAAMYLAAAGVGTIGLSMQMKLICPTYASDHSRHRRCRKSKSKICKRDHERNEPDVTVNTYREFVTSENIMDLIKDYDFIIVEPITSRQNS